MNSKQLQITAVMWAVGAGVAVFAIVSFRRGHMRVNRKNITRKANPVAFWIWTIYFFLVAAFTFALPVWKFMR